MPFFKKGRPQSERLIDRDVMKPLPTGGFADRVSWDHEETPLDEIVVGKRLIDSIERRIPKLSPGQRVKVLGWGCGKGLTDYQLAERYPNHVYCIGYSPEGYRGWEEYSKKPNLDFIQTTHRALERYLRRHQVDIIYENKAFEHVDFNVLAQHLINLRFGLRPGGEIIFQPFDERNPQVREFIDKCRTYYEPIRTWGDTGSVCGFKQRGK